MKIVELSAEDFDNYAKSHENANPWQTSNFGKAAETLGYNILYLGFEDSLAIKGVTLLLTKVVYMGQSLSYAPRGPLLDFEDYHFAEEAFKVFRRYLIEKKIMSFTMDPPIVLSIRNKNGSIKDNNKNDQKSESESIKANVYARDIVNFFLKKLNFEYRGQNLYFEGILPRWYAITSLPINSKTLLSKTNKKVRTKLRKAARLGIEILRDDTKNIDFIYNIAKEKFNRPIEYYQNLIDNNPDCEIYIARINSEKYVINSKALYEKEMEKNEVLTKLIQEKNDTGKNMQKIINQKMASDKVISSYKEHLIKSTQTLKDYPDGRIVAFSIVIKHGNKITIFEDGFLKEYSNLNAAHLLRWKIIEQYSNSESKTFIFGEITGGFDITRNPLYGLNQSKLAFKGNIMEYIGEFGIMINKTMYNLYQATNGLQQVFKFTNQ